MELYRATEGKVGTDEMMVCSILSTRNDNQIRAINHAYEQKFRRRLEDVIKKVSRGFFSLGMNIFSHYKALTFSIGI